MCLRDKSPACTYGSCGSYVVSTSFDWDASRASVVLTRPSDTVMYSLSHIPRCLVQAKAHRKQTRRKLLGPRFPEQPGLGSATRESSAVMYMGSLNDISKLKAQKEKTTMCYETAAVGDPSSERSFKNTAQHCTTLPWSRPAPPPIRLHRPQLSTTGPKV